MGTNCADPVKKAPSHSGPGPLPHQVPSCIRSCLFFSPFDPSVSLVDTGSLSCRTCLGHMTRFWTKKRGEALTVAVPPPPTPRCTTSRTGTQYLPPFFLRSHYLSDSFGVGTPTQQRALLRCEGSNSSLVPTRSQCHGQKRSMAFPSSLWETKPLNISNTPSVFLASPAFFVDFIFLPPDFFCLKLRDQAKFGPSPKG